MNKETLPNPPSDASAVEQAVASKEIDRPITYRSLLVPIDFSEHSKKTTEYATQLAALTGASIKILHILQMPAYPAGFYEGIYVQPDLIEGVVEAAKQDANEQLSQVLGEILAKGLPAQSILRMGIAYEEIVSVADEMDIDLIVIGSRGYRGLGRLLLGSTAERVLQYAPCAVLVVKDAPVTSLPAKTVEAKED